MRKLRDAPASGARRVEDQEADGESLATRRLEGQGDDVHPVGEVVSEHGQQDDEPDVGPGLESEPDRETVEGAVEDQAQGRQDAEERRWRCRVAGRWSGRRRPGLLRVLEAGLVDERLDQAERDEPSERGDTHLEPRTGANELVRLGQEVGDRRCDDDARGERHEDVQPVPQPQRGQAAGERREERQDGGERHVGYRSVRRGEGCGDRRPRRSASDEALPPGVRNQRSRMRAL